MRTERKFCRLQLLTLTDSDTRCSNTMYNVNECNAQWTTLRVPFLCYSVAVMHKRAPSTAHTVSVYTTFTSNMSVERTPNTDGLLLRTASQSSLRFFDPCFYNRCTETVMPRRAPLTTRICTRAHCCKTFHRTNGPNTAKTCASFIAIHIAKCGRMSRRCRCIISCACGSSINCRLLNSACNVAVLNCACGLLCA